MSVTDSPALTDPLATVADGFGIAGEGVEEAVLSPGWALLQLAKSVVAQIVAAVRIALFMLSGTPSADFCAALAPRGLVAGVDEAGRGPLAGPVVAAAVVLCRPRPGGLDDSKKLAPTTRAILEERIRRRCAFGIGVVDVAEIDQLNIFGATMLAMTLATTRLAQVLRQDPGSVLVDGNLTPQGRRAEWRWPARAIIGGDAREPCIAAASILAKTWRDRLMQEATRAHPHYGWERNMGYGTPDHLAALRKHGPCPLHRRSFAPVAQHELSEQGSVLERIAGGHTSAS